MLPRRLSLVLFVASAVLFITSIVIFSNRDATPATATTPVVTSTIISALDTSPSENQPTMTTPPDSEAYFGAMGFGRLPWGITLSGENKVCFATLRTDPRNCDGTTLKITAQTPLLVLKNGEILASLKVNDTVFLEFNQDTTYDFYGLANRNYPFIGNWISQMFMWSDISKTYPILLLPQQDGHDRFIDLAEGITYDLPADTTIFDYTVTSPTMGYLNCSMGSTCVFTP